MARLYLAPASQVVVLNHSLRTISIREPLIWHDRPWRRSTDEDTSCAAAIVHSGSHYRFAGEDRIAGVPVVKWAAGEDALWMAPSLDCMPLKSYRIQRNPWYVPVFVWSVEAKSVKLGDPDTALFQLPGNYTRVPDPQEDYLRSRARP